MTSERGILSSVGIPHCQATMITPHVHRSSANPSTTPARASTFAQLVRRLAHAVVYHLHVKHAIARIDVTSMFGFSLCVPSGVFHPRFYLTSRFFGEFLRSLDLRQKRVLEMGCGSGILSLIAAREGARVMAVDINPLAVDCTRLNARVNHLQDSIATVNSDLFESIPEDEAFDIIVWSPPFYPREPVDDASRAWDAGTGFSVISRFAARAGQYLRPGGTLLILLSSEIDVEAIATLFTNSCFTPAVVRSKKKLFETLMIYEFAPSRKSR